MRIWAVVAAVAVFVIDRVTKIIVRATIEPGDRIEVLPFLDLVHTTNRGIAFGLFSGYARIVAILTAAALCAIAVGLTRWGHNRPIVLIGGAMLIGGAIGNLVDRLIRGGVTDFIAVTDHWPPFNVADSAIVLGAALAAWGLTNARPH